MPHYNAAPFNLAARDFGLQLLESANAALAAALPEQAEKVAAVLAGLKAELGAELTPVKGKGKRGRAAAAAAAGGAPAPKRAPSEYNIYMGEQMKRLGAEHKGLPKAEILKMVGESWRAEKAARAAKAAAAPAPAAPAPAAPAKAGKPAK